MENSTTRFLAVLVLVLTIISTASITKLLDGGSNISGSGVNKADVENLIDDYLKRHPEAIVNAFTEARKEQERLETERAEKTIISKKDSLENDPGTPFYGNPNGDVVIVEFFDYNCGYCKRVTPELITLLNEDKNIKLVIKDFPVLGPKSVTNAMFSLAVNKLDSSKFFEFHSEMLKVSPRNEEQVLAIAEKIGIDKEALRAEKDKAIHKNQLQKNIALAQAIGVRGTPAFVINGEFVRGAISLDQFRQKVKAARAKKRS